MANIRINRVKETIEITKAFAKKAEQFKSAEYNELREAMKDNEGFSVVVKGAPKKDVHKGLTFDYMKQYIENKGNEELMEEFNTLTKNSDGIRTESYGKVREWFLTSFPEIDEVINANNEARKAIFEKVKARKAEMAKTA